MSLDKSIADLEAFKQLVNCSRYNALMNKSSLFEKIALVFLVALEHRIEKLLSAVQIAIVDCRTLW